MGKYSLHWALVIASRTAIILYFIRFCIHMLIQVTRLSINAANFKNLGSWMWLELKRRRTCVFGSHPARKKAQISLLRVQWWNASFAAALTTLNGVDSYNQR